MNPSSHMPAKYLQSNFVVLIFHLKNNLRIYQSIISGDGINKTQVFDSCLLQIFFIFVNFQEVYHKVYGMLYLENKHD